MKLELEPVGTLDLKAWFVYNEMTYGVIGAVEDKIKVYNVSRGRMEYLSPDTLVARK